MGVWFRVLLVLVLATHVVYAKEKLLDLNKYELVPAPKKGSFQKYKLNENIIFGTNLEKKIESSDSTIYYEQSDSRITFDLLKDEDFTIIQSGAISGSFYIIFSDDIANKFVVRSSNGSNEHDYSMPSLSGLNTLKIVKKSKQIELYVNNKLLKSFDLVQLDELKHIELLFSGDKVKDFFVLKD